MSRTTITNDNNRNQVTMDINPHELSIIQTSIALTMAYIIETRRSYSLQICRYIKMSISTCKVLYLIFRIN
jgi:hypothetical protein